MDKELEKLLGDWMIATNEGNQKNKVAEKIGELCADQEIKRRYGSRIQRTLAIPRAGKKVWSSSISPTNWKATPS